MAKPKFIDVGSQSLSPPMIIEGGIRYVAETPEKLKSIVLENGDSVEIRPDRSARYSVPPEPEPPHELDVIQRLSEAFRAEGLRA